MGKLTIIYIQFYITKREIIPLKVSDTARKSQQTQRQQTVTNPRKVTRWMSTTVKFRGMIFISASCSCKHLSFLNNAPYKLFK